MGYLVDLCGWGCFCGLGLICVGIWFVYWGRSSFLVWGSLAAPGTLGSRWAQHQKSPLREI